METERQRLSAAERSNLVAYLDGELREEESKEIAAKLTNSISGRREIDALERTWAMLDLLPMPRTSPEFATQTVTLATGIASLDDRLASAATRIGTHVARWLVCTLAAAVLFMVGYTATRWLWPDPTAKLARELSIAEHFEEYQAVGSLNFLKQLDESAEFNRLGE